MVQTHAGHNSGRRWPSDLGHARYHKRCCHVGKGERQFNFTCRQSRHRGVTISDYSLRFLPPHDTGQSGIDSGLSINDHTGLTNLSTGPPCRAARERFGFMFQAFNLRPALAAAENIADWPSQSA